MVYDAYKDFARKIVSDKVLPDKSFEIGSNPKYDGSHWRLAAMIYNFW